MAQRTLNVKKTSNLELAHKWGFNFNPNIRGGIYIRCNFKGVVNWDKALVYNLDWLLDRGKVNIIN